MFERIRLRLTVGYVGILALILILFGTIVVVGFSQQTTAQQDELLMREAESKQSLFYSDNDEDNADRNEEDNADRVSPNSTDDSEEVAWAAITPNGRVIEQTSRASSLGLPSTEQVRQAAGQEKTSAATIEGSDAGVRVVSVPVVQWGKVVGVVQAAQSLDVVRETVNRLIFVLVPIGLVALALATVGGLFMSGRAMRPVQSAFEKQRKFIGDASHELKTPLTLIRADAEVVTRDPANPRAQKLINHLLEETDRMNTLLSDLLILARLDAGELALARQPFNLGEVLTEIADRFSALATAEGVHLEVEVYGKLPASGDRERTSQILVALLYNALRHTPSGGRITMEGKLSDEWVEALVSDTGPGIAPEHLTRIFDRFYRGEEARTREEGGTGLGLAIARDLARAQGGDLTARNTQEGGAVFRLKLPAS
jgi:signal transduction histidine kinase